MLVQIIAAACGMECLQNVTDTNPRVRNLICFSEIVICRFNFEMTRCHNIWEFVREIPLIFGYLMLWKH
jgi:hypothetical protein